MQKKPEKNTEKIPEKLFLNEQKPRRIRVLMLKTMGYLLLYNAMTVREIVEKLATENMKVSTRVMRDRIIKDIEQHPLPCFVMEVKTRRIGPRKKPTPAYQLKRI